jgi:hypothetical protein
LDVVVFDADLPLLPPQPAAVTASAPVTTAVAAHAR